MVIVKLRKEVQGNVNTLSSSVQRILSTTILTQLEFLFLTFHYYQNVTIYIVPKSIPPSCNMSLDLHLESIGYNAGHPYKPQRCDYEYFQSILETPKITTKLRHMTITTRHLFVANTLSGVAVVPLQTLSVFLTPFVDQILNLQKQNIEGDPCLVSWSRLNLFALVPLSLCTLDWEVPCSMVAGPDLPLSLR